MPSIESYDRSIKDLNDLKEFEKKKGGPRFEVRNVQVGTDPNTGEAKYETRYLISGTHSMDPDHSKALMDQVEEINQRLRTNTNPLSGTAGSMGTPPVGAPPLPPSTPGYGQPGNAIQ